MAKKPVKKSAAKRRQLKATPKKQLAKKVVVKLLRNELRQIRVLLKRHQLKNFAS
ncbi:MAG: hypothetical protein CM15mP95_2430 [Alphaproteobacteria bacterium]|nr:MAG: hypothetical protein CM15mP95_2430 [Alphaproteobacteria bacterium]